MIRALIAGKNGRPAILLGLTAENVERFQAGEPIFADGRSLMGCPVDVILVYGRTALDIVAELRAAGADLPEGAEDKVAGGIAPGQEVVLVDRSTEPES